MDFATTVMLKQTDFCIDLKILGILDQFWEAAQFLRTTLTRELGGLRILTKHGMFTPVALQDSSQDLALMRLVMIL